jgi:lipoate-protein ligase A
VGVVADIEQRLAGIRYDRDAIEKAFADVDVKHYFGDITKEEFIDLVY